MSTLNPGSLLLFHGKSACLDGFSGEKLEIRIEGGSSKSVRLKDVTFLHPGPVSTLPPAIPGKPDIEGVLELMGEELLPFGEAAELLYSDKGPGAFYGTWLLLKEGVYFTGSPEEGIRCRPREEIEKTLHASALKEEAKKRKAELVERLRTGTLLPEDRPAMTEIEQVAFGINGDSSLMRELGMEPLPEKAHQLLLKLKVWDETIDPIPHRNSVDLTDPEWEIPPLPEEEREDLTGMKAWAIDNEGSQDPDDAISFQDGLLWVHVADPSAVVTEGSPLDQQAKSAGENLYLPEKTVHMLPPAMTEIFGLGLRETSPALSFAVRIDENGEAKLEKFCLSRVHVQRETYDSARLLQELPEFREMQEALARFRQYRAEHGALFIRLPEVEIHASEGKVSIVPTPVTPERELVANAMLAAGAAVGEYASSRSISMPFACQDASGEIQPETESLSAMYLLRKSCSQGFLSPVSQPHGGLGLSAYVRVTSPLRRYADLLAHRQLRRLLKGDEPISSDEMETMYPEAEQAGILRRKTERMANEFWTMAYLIQHPGWEGTAVVADHPDDRTAFLIPELAYEFKMRGFGDLRPDEQVRIQLTSVDLPLSSARFRILGKAEEEQENS